MHQYMAFDTRSKNEGQRRVKGRRVYYGLMSYQNMSRVPDATEEQTNRPSERPALTGYRGWQPPVTHPKW